MVRRSFVEYAAALTRALRGKPRPAATLTDHLEGFEVAALAADDQGRYIGANTRACLLTGYSHTELLTRRVSDLVVAETPGNDPAPLWDTFAAEGYQHGHVILRRSDDTTIAVSYDAFGNVASGVNVSFLVPVDAPTT